MNQRRLQVVITGRVQMVGFRLATRRVARQFLLRGWVRNSLEDSNKVEAVFEGDEEALKRILKWCYQGPPLSHVINVDFKWEKWNGEFTNFTVKF